MASATCIGFRF